MRTIKGTQYRKAKTQDRKMSRPSRFPGGAPMMWWSIGKVHLMFRDKQLGWRFVCGKRIDPSMFAQHNWDIVDDITTVTCLNCMKHAPEIVAEFIARLGTPDYLDADAEELDYG